MFVCKLHIGSSTKKRGCISVSLAVIFCFSLEWGLSIIRGRSRSQVPTITHLKVVVKEQEGQTTLLREVEMSIIRERSRAQVPTITHLKVVVEELEG